MMINILRQGLGENMEEIGERLCWPCYFYSSPRQPCISMSSHFNIQSQHCPAEQSGEELEVFTEEVMAW